MAAVEVGWAILHSGDITAEGVEVALWVFKTYQKFNAGFGATLNSEGNVELGCSDRGGY